VLNYVTDADVVSFLRTAAAALGKGGGLLVVKESVARGETGAIICICTCICICVCVCVCICICVCVCVCRCV
jgi:hypothetical protein